MKITILLIILALTQVHATVHSQAIITEMKFQDVSLKDAFDKIENETGFKFLYRADLIDMNQLASVKVENVTIFGLLNKLLQKTEIEYKIVNTNLVVLTPRLALTITGKVTSAIDGLPIPGVNITEKGTNNGTITDFEGKFSLNVSSENATLVFSIIGYENLEIALEGKTSIDVSLNEQIENLEQVIIVGYGTQKKSDLTGSISSVKGKDIETLSIKRVDQALQGRVSGVTIQNTDGAPGGNTVIRVRGSNSVLGGNDALIVIDGMQGGDINKLNPNDIESIEVLKDASATAIYGSRGANGVILITTKKGQIGKPVITYSMSAGLQKLSKKLDLLNAGDYARNINAVKDLANGSGTPPIHPFTDEQITYWDQNGGTDWQDEIYRTAPIMNNQLSISGGTENVKYYISGGMLNQEGILINSGYKRYSFRSNVSATFNKWLSGGLNLSVVKDDGKSPPFGGESGENLILQGSVNNAPRWGAVIPVYDENGNYSMHPAGWGVYDTWNPVASALEVDPSIQSLNNTGNAFFDIKIAKGLTLNVSGFANVVTSKNSKFYNEKTKQGLPVGGKGGQGYLSNGYWQYYQASANLTYEKTIGVHHFTVTAVAEQSIGKWSGSDIDASQFVYTTTGLNDLSGAGQVINTSNANERSLKSYLGRLNYSLLDRYLLTVSYRADGSSVFGADNKWGYFPSASLAWKLSEEEFIKNMDFFTVLKLRTSIGVTGNQGISPYQSLASIGSGLNYPWNGGTNTNSGFGLSSPANPNLKWESTTQSNIGLDLAILKGRLTATFDVYKKTTENLLLYRELPTSSGFGSIIDNIGSTENKGLEIEISGDPLVGDFKWNTGINFTMNRSKVLNLGTDKKIGYITSSGGYGLDEPLMNLVVGEPFGQMYGWGYEGTWKTSEAQQAALYGQLPGDPRYTDVNNDTLVDTQDLKVIGNAQPKFVFGWNNKFNYKNFDLNFLFQGVYGNNIFNQVRIRMEAPSEATSTNILNRWTTNNQNTDVPAYIDEVTRRDANLINHVYVDGRVGRWVENGSYIRLKTVTLGYTLPENILSKVGISNLRAYVSATNLFTITKYTWYDPEVSSYNTDDGAIGVDFGNYPSARIFSFGLDVSF